MRKTKIICTLGPSTDQEGVLRELVANGMNVARFNFSHGSHEEHLGRFEKLKAIREELGKPVAALLDTKGPEIRLKDFKNGVENLVAGQTFTLTMDGGEPLSVRDDTACAYGMVGYAQYAMGRTAFGNLTLEER